MVLTFSFASRLATAAVVATVSLALVGPAAMLWAQAGTGGEPKPSTAIGSKTSTSSGSQAVTSAPMAKAPALPSTSGETIDRVVAIVNAELVLDSDVDEERRFEAFQPYLSPTPGTYSRDRAIERLINRDLILQQAKLMPGDTVTDDDVTKQIDSLRKEIPACKAAHCETDAGWKDFLAARGFTEAIFAARWKQRMQSLAFIEDRFRLGISITPEQIATYYRESLLPLYAHENATAPKLDAISGRVRELLLQQQVSALLTDWLKSLRAQGGVVVLHPGAPAP